MSETYGIEGTGAENDPYIPKNSSDFVHLLTDEKYRRMTSSGYQAWIYIKLVYDIDLSEEVQDYEPDPEYNTSYIEIKNTVRVYSKNGSKLICTLPEKYRNTDIKYVFTLFDNDNSYHIGWGMNTSGYGVAWYILFENIFIEFNSTPISDGIQGSSLVYSVDKWPKGNAGHGTTLTFNKSKISLYPYKASSGDSVYYKIIDGGPGTTINASHITLHGEGEISRAYFPVISCWDISHTAIEVENVYYSAMDHSVFISNVSTVSFTLLYFGNGCHLKGSHRLLNIDYGTSYRSLGNLIYLSENTRYDKGGNIGGEDYDAYQFGYYTTGKSGVCSYNDYAKWKTYSPTVQIYYTRLTPENIKSELSLTWDAYESAEDKFGGVPYPVYSGNVPEVTELKPEPPEPVEQKPMILNDALDVYLGPYPVSRVYMGDYLIWQRLTMPYMDGVVNYYDCRRGVGNPEDPNDKNWYNLVSDQYPMQLTSINIADDGSVRFWGPYKAEEDDDPNPGTTVNTVHGAFVSPESNDQTVYIVYKVCSEYSLLSSVDSILMSQKEQKPEGEMEQETIKEILGVSPYATLHYTYEDLFGELTVGYITPSYYEVNYGEYCVAAFRKIYGGAATRIDLFVNGKFIGLTTSPRELANGKFWGVCCKGNEWIDESKNHEDTPLSNTVSNNIGFPEINVKMIAVANTNHSDEKILQNCRFLMDQYNTADDMANFAPMDGLEFNGSQIVDTHFVVRNGLMGATNPWVRINVKLQNYESGGVYGHYEDGRYAPTLGACFIGSGNYGYMYAGLGKDTLWKSAYYDIKPNDSSVWECTMAVNLQTRQVNLSYKNKSLTSYYKIDPEHPTTTLLEKAIQLGYSDGTTGSSNLKATVLSFQIKDGTGKLLVDMVPMKRRSGGQLGMYDRACSKFRALTDIE